MVTGSLILCAQCGAVVDGDPVALGDELFCCLGCVGGGPCICERHDQALLSLRIGPFASQAELLRFAARLEQAPGLIHVELVRPELAEAAFTVVAPTAEVVALAVEATPDLVVTTESTDTTVIARLTPRGRPRAAGEEDGLLPTRTRFRVFRAAEAATTAEPSTPAPPASPEDEVAAMLADARRAAAVRLPLPDATAPAEPEPTPAPAAILVLGGPFNSFAAVNDFQGIVRALRGVTEVRVRRFYKGTLHLLVEYEDDVPFADRLLAVTGGACAVTAATADQLEIRVCSPEAFSTPGR
ncbi:MAG: hypothetical protein AB7G21_05035 [Dehalococcoidia bacterium]